MGVEGEGGGVWFYLVKHSADDVALGKESVGIEVRRGPYEDLLIHVYI